jgi:UDP-glucose 4-epimerase
MRVLVVGAGGNLGRVVVPALMEAGHTARLADARALEAEQEFVRVDVRSPEQVRRAMRGVDAVVHAAALHGIHLERWPPQDFWQVNVTGTFNVLEAAREAGVRRLVLCSTMAVYGQSAEPPGDAWAVVSDNSPTLPTDVYGMSKWLCEQLGRYYARHWGIGTVALRLGMFVPETFERYGFRLLFGGVDDRDVAQAVLLALEHDSAGSFDHFNVFADVPFTPEDAQALQEDPGAVLDRHWPGCTKLVHQRGLDLGELLWGRAMWSTDKARRLLGYRPRYNFTEFLAAWRADDATHYPFAGLPWWGV